MFPQGGNETDLSNSTFPSSLQNTETRYFVLCQELGKKKNLLHPGYYPWECRTESSKTKHSTKSSHSFKVRPLFGRKNSNKASSSSNVDSFVGCSLTLFRSLTRDCLANQSINQSINQSFILTRYVKELKNSFKIRTCINKIYNNYSYIILFNFKNNSINIYV